MKLQTGGENARFFFMKKALRFKNESFIMIKVVQTSGLWLQVDASRRRNDPRKQGKSPGEHGAA